MSKISVFKFNVNGNENLIKELINEYLTPRGFVYNEEEQAYMFTPKDNRTMSEKALDGALQGLIGALLSGGSSASVTTIYDGSFCFKYNIENGMLIIKAYLKEKNGYKGQITQNSLSKSVPAKNYYNDLNKNLFIKLKNNYIDFVGTKVEKINDGKLSPTTISLLVAFGVMIAFLAFIILYFKSHI